MPQFSGILLSGGYSRRMGRDKALLDLGGRPVIARLADELSKVAAGPVIACGEQEREEYRFLGLTQVPDLYPGCGPLAGLHAALLQSPTEWSVVAACDLPFASAEFMRYMMSSAAEPGRDLVRNYSGGSLQIDAAVPESITGRVQPLLGLYHKRVLPVLEEALHGRRFRVMECLDALEVLYIPEAGFTASPSEPSPLYNMNTPADYAAALKLVSTPADDSSV
ncbi:molybdenum cofactor guanylyltransferase [Paenibacillus sonchi]|uniref:Probable molybdenum cofactor guanylyltransferase n=1 Tax=Paenibacillus sonchi TaxID=373687 RepID=A0A974PF74_9BACL|nr:molybdenum cofactor guanylyltransferase [Paenibacillus sonchi]QQZ62283.1 molybdenum cofactor guanylyltransferase [Paenibacillus sonchi]